jgi:hypothetical protein
VLYLTALAFLFLATYRISRRTPEDNLRRLAEAREPQAWEGWRFFARIRANLLRSGRL